jgi:hypothetical protein
MAAVIVTALILTWTASTLVSADSIVSQVADGHRSQLHALMQEIALSEATDSGVTAASRAQVSAQMASNMQKLGGFAVRALTESMRTAKAPRFEALQAPPEQGNVGKTATRKSCNKTKFEASLASYSTECSGYKVDPLFDFNTYDNTSITAVNAICSNVCTAKLVAILRESSACLSRDLKMTARIVVSLCAFDNTTKERCGVNLKKFQFLSCDSRKTQATCEAPNYQCQWTPNKDCQPKATDEFLATFCRPCLANFLRWALRANPTLKFLEALVLQFWCRKVDGSFCMPRLAYVWADNTTLALKSSAADTTAYLDRSCSLSNTTGKCYRGLIKVYTRISLEGQKDVLRACIKDATGGPAKRECYKSFNNWLENWQKLRKLLAMMCRKNAGGDFCFAAHIKLLESPCAVTLLTPPNYRCNATCSAFMQQSVMDMGCCLEWMHRWVNGPLPYVDPKLLPPTARDFAAAAPIAAPINASDVSTISQHLYQVVRACPTIAGNVTIVRSMWQECAADRLVRRNFTIRLRLPWSRTRAVADLNDKIAEALSDDFSSYMAVNQDDVAEGALSEDRAISVTTTSTNAHGFEVLQTSSGVAWTSSVSAPDAATADAAVASAATGASTGDASLAVTSGVVSGECANCLSDDDPSLLSGDNFDEDPLPEGVADVTAAPSTLLRKSGAAALSSLCVLLIGLIIF